MERGGFHGYHHKLPRMISSSDLTHQGMNGKSMDGVMSHGSSNGRMIAHDQMLNLNPNNNHSNGNNSNNNSHKLANVATGSEDPNECIVREQDRFMPIANVIRIMRKTLPPHAKISDDAKETIQECVSELISFVTGEANERCQREQRKTITAEDVLWAMSKLGFDDYVDPLTVYLHRYRELEGDRGGAMRGDPTLVKRGYEFSGSPYAPVFHMAAHHPSMSGYYGPPPPGGHGFMKEAQAPPRNGCGGGSGQPGFEPYGQQNKE